MGRQKITNGGIVSSQHASDIYGIRQLGERGPLHHSSHMDGFLSSPGLMAPEEDLLDAAHADGSSPEISANECHLSCLAASEFLCSRSCMCIPMYTRCDGDMNCDDGEDEEECSASNEEIIKGIRTECEADGRHVMCPRTFTCISEDWLCDGDDDCGDYSDETRCGAHVNCSDDQFECQNGLCIQQSWMCDGDNDCKDFSDEFNCTKLS